MAFQPGRAGAPSPELRTFYLPNPRIVRDAAHGHASLGRLLELAAGMRRAIKVALLAAVPLVRNASADAMPIRQSM
jgi:hypothetical protein